MNIDAKVYFSIFSFKFQDSTPGSDEFKALKRQIQNKCPVYEEILRRDFNNSTRVEYELRQSPYVHQIFDHLDSVADVIARPRPSRLPGFLSTSSEPDFCRKEIGKFVHHDGSSDKDTNSCCFSGATFIDSGRFVVADWNNTCLKMFNSKGLLIQRLVFPNNPWDVKMHPEGGLIVTVPGEQRIYTVGFEGGFLEILSSFETDCECWGVVPLNGRIAVTCDPWSKTPSVKVYSLCGKLQSFYQKESSGASLFAYPEHITTDVHQQILYVSDARKQMVLAITLDGCVLFRYVHELLDTPTGITTDAQGNIYVCGKESQNIHQISKTGEHIRIIADKQTVGAPRALSMHPECEMMIVTDISSDSCDDVITVDWT